MKARLEKNSAPHSSVGKKKCFTIVDNANLNLLDKLQKKHLYQAYLPVRYGKPTVLKRSAKKSMCRPRRLSALSKKFPRRNRPKVGPFWAVGMYPWVHYTLGGIAIDEEARALDNDSRPIAGLYAAGQIIRKRSRTKPTRRQRT